MLLCFVWVGVRVGVWARVRVWFGLLVFCVWCCGVSSCGVFSFVLLCVFVCLFVWFCLLLFLCCVVCFVVLWIVLMCLFGFDML